RGCGPRQGPVVGRRRHGPGPPRHTRPPPPRDSPPLRTLTPYEKHAKKRNAATPPLLPVVESLRDDPDPTLPARRTGRTADAGRPDGRSPWTGARPRSEA